MPSSSATSRSRSASGSASTQPGASGPLVTRSGGAVQRQSRLRGHAARRRHVHRGPAPRRARTTRSRLRRARRSRRRRGITSRSPTTARAAPPALRSVHRRRSARRRACSSITCSAASSTTARTRATGAATPPLRIGRRHDETLQDVSVDELRVYDRQLTTLRGRGARRRRPIRWARRCATPAASRYAGAAGGAARALSVACRPRLRARVRRAHGAARQGERHC